MTAIVIQCPGCKKELGSAGASFKQAEKGYPYFDLQCMLCFHEWEAHVSDFEVKTFPDSIPLKRWTGRAGCTSAHTTDSTEPVSSSERQTKEERLEPE